MSATGMQLNWTAVGFTPSGGSLTPISKVTSVQLDLGGELLSFKGDNDRFPTIKVCHTNDPKFTIQASNPAAILGFTTGTEGTFTATHKDAKGAMGGDIVYTLINAKIGRTSTSGQHAQFGDASLTIESTSSDGSTSPLSYTRA